MPLRPHPNSSAALPVAVGIAALVAPALHSVTDIMEGYQHGFSTGQLWINYAAFLPMSWLLLGIYAVHEPRPGVVGLIGALLYGAAFTYFAHTTLYALAEHTPDYESLWERLGSAYTIHGAIMICGGLLFSVAALRARWLWRLPVQLFLIGIVVNLIVGVLPAPAILQTIGSALRNLGLMGMGYNILAGHRLPGKSRPEPHP